MGLKPAGLRDSIRNLTQALPANFDVTITSTNEPITEGETLDVNYDVENTGDIRDSQTILLEIDNTQEDSEPVTLTASELLSSQLNWVTQDGEAGDYTASVISDDDVSSTTVTVESTIPDSGLVHRWAFDEGSGSTAADSVGTADGSITDATWQSGAGAGDYYLYFNGSSENRVTVPNSVLDNLVNFTVLAWVRTGEGSTNQRWFGSRNGGYEGSVHIGTDTDGTMIAVHDARNGGTTIPVVDTTEDLSDNQWSLFVYGEDDSSAYIYRDTTEVGSNSSGDYSVATASGLTTTFGYSSRQPQVWYDDMGEAALYHKKMTPAEIEQYYDATKSAYQ